MRLTLRTLLAYLDDTLEPGQTRLIGQKIAESPKAQELVEKIKKVTRRRSLGAPDDGDNPAADPNLVAEYLDNVLNEEDVKELEALALESDSHLAEIAASHQILTLVLGEPAAVPPTAKQRMYRLVKGPESIPFRKPSGGMAAGAREPEPADDLDSEYDFVLPAARPGKKNRGRMFVGAAALAGLAGLAVYMAVPKGEKANPTNYPIFASVADTGVEEPQVKKDVVAVKPPEEPKKAPLEPMPVPMEVPAPNLAGLELLPQPREIIGGVAAKPEFEVPAPKPSLVRTPIGNWVGSNQMLVAKAPPMEIVKLPREDVWHRIGRAEPGVFSTDILLAPPGYHPEVKLSSGVHLTLWGNLPEFIDLPLLESKIVAHFPGEGYDADITLASGRLFVRNDKPDGPAKIRVRVNGEAWEIVLLTPKAEICMDRFERYPPGVPFARRPDGDPPKTEIYLGLVTGKATVRVGFKVLPEMQAPALVEWDNKGGGLRGPSTPDPKLVAIWNKVAPKFPGAGETSTALIDLEKRFQNPADPLDVDWAAVFRGETEKLSRRIVALFGLESIDAVTDLVDALGEEAYPIRQAAILALRHWSGGGAARDLQLVDVMTNKRGFSEIHAWTVAELLHTFSEEDAKKQRTIEDLLGYLGHERIQIRELAYWHLLRIDPIGAREAAYDPNGTDAARTNAVNKWRASWKKRNDAKKPKK